MSDNFTHNVHVLMNGFQLTPSEDVWKKVEQGIQKDKKRRPKFFWWLFPMFVLLLGGGTFMLVQSASTESAKNKNAAQTQKPLTVNENITENQIAETNSADKNIKTNELVVENKLTAVDKPENTNRTSPVVQVETKANATIADKSNKAYSSQRNDTTQSNMYFVNTKKNKENNNEPSFLVSRTKKQKKESVQNTLENANGEAGDYAAPIIDEDGTTQSNALENIKPLENISPIELSTKIQNPHLSIAPIKDNNHFKKQQDATNKPIVKQRNWHFQIVAGAGTSNLSSGVSGIFDAQKSFIRPSSIILPAGNSAPPSDIKPNAFYNVGLEISYDVKKRLQLNTGLHLNAFSNSIQVGSLVSTPTRFFDANGQYLFEKEEYYTNSSSGPNTNQFNNQYLFFNMPLGINYEFARLKTMSFHVQTGFDLGYLLSNESMIFDDRQNIYYAPTTELNKWRYGLHIGASINLMKDQLSINPMFRLGLNNLYNAGSYSNLSLSSFGVQMKLQIK